MTRFYNTHPFNLLNLSERIHGSIPFMSFNPPFDHHYYSGGN